MGFSILYVLTLKDLFKHYLVLEPSEAQFFSSITTIPWGLKVLFGIFIDNVRIFGSVRTIHLKISGVSMAVILLSLRIPILQDKYITLVLLFWYNMFASLTDVCMNAILVSLARLDPIHGPSDLQSLHIIAVCIGGI